MTDELDNDNEDNATDTEIRDIYMRLMKDEAIVLSMYRRDLASLRKNLSLLKSRDNAKMKDAGVEPDNAKLEFVIINDDKKSKEIELRIELKESMKIQVIGEIKTLSGDLL